MAYTVYVIKNKDGLLYKGITNCLERRLKERSEGSGRWTRTRGPFELVYQEEFDSRKEALMREKFLKSGQGREYLREVIGA